MGFITIGLEIHVTLKTEYKAFSPDKADDVSWITLGFPGTLPTLNLEAVLHTIKLALAFNCEFDACGPITFDRKNYFYYDLPRGYQITQYFNPIGKKGFVNLRSGKIIRIKQIHLEEDTTQQSKGREEIRLNFSRLGKALAEVVTEPDFESFEEVEEFLKILRRICTFNEISGAAYENGEIRVDLNLSVRDNIQDPLNNKSEVKNLNSLTAIRKSIDFLVKSKPDKDSYTYAWVENTQTCEVMRKKGGVSDYFYIPEANICFSGVDTETYEEIVKNIFNDFSGLEKELIDKGLKEVEVEYLLDNYQVYKWVSKLDKGLGNMPNSYNWIVNIVSGIMVDNNWPNLPYTEIKQVVYAVEKTKDINLTIAKNILKEILVNKKTFKEIYKKLNVNLISDKESIYKLVEEAFEQYQDQIPSLIGNIYKLEKLIIGTCMKKSKGQADPVLTKSVFDEMVKKFIG